MNDDKITTLWSFLKNLKNTEKEIEIPIIQRDYAQGREGMKYLYLRKNFLEKLRHALDTEDKLILDFVYGSEMNKKFQPLDGQQRLTTLWLLHWYIALRAGKLEEACGILNRFSYETRISSREFCQNLCKPEYFKKFNGVKIVDFIKNQTWFYSAWNQDPTVQSMLRMLSGTKINGKDSKDGIEECFKENFVGYWDKLTERDPIVFYLLDLKDFGLSDDLYIRMNARGKPLKDFENFKADLIGYIREQYGIAEEKNLENKDNWKKLLNEKEGIPIKLDTDWTNIFWDNKSENNKIDEIYFVFLNRFFLNYKIKEIKYSSDIGYLTSDGKLYVEVEPKNAAKIKYNGLDKYKWKDKIDIGLFEDLQTILDNYCEFQKKIKKGEQIFKCPWEDYSFEFIPFYSEPQVIQGISWAETIVFYAICKYFKEGKADEENLKRWMRFAWNMTYSFHEIGIGVSEVQNIIKRIDKIKNSHDIYNELVQLKDDGKDDIPDRQFKEECTKAKKIFNKEVEKLREYSGNSLKEDGSKYKTWEEIIIASEKYAFFNGTIRFLYQDADGKEEGWGYFDDKWKNSRIFFGEKEENGSCLKSGNSAELLKRLISRFTEENYKNILFRNGEEGIFNNKTATWRYYLLNRDICSSVHHLLLNEPINEELGSFDDSNKKVVQLLIGTKLLDSIVKKEQEDHGWCLYDNLWGCKGFYRRRSHESSGKFVILDSWIDSFLENEDLLEGKGIINITRNQEMIEGTNGLHYGYNDVYFDYGGKHWHWDKYGNVYLQQDKAPFTPDAREKRPNKEEFYCLGRQQDNNESVDTKAETIVSGLKKLIDEYEEDMKKEKKP